MFVTDRSCALSARRYPDSLRLWTSGDRRGPRGWRRNGFPAPSSRRRCHAASYVPRRRCGRRQGERDRRRRGFPPCRRGRGSARAAASSASKLALVSAAALTASIPGSIGRLLRVDLLNDLGLDRRNRSVCSRDGDHRLQEQILPDIPRPSHLPAPSPNCRRIWCRCASHLPMLAMRKNRLLL